MEIETPRPGPGLRALMFFVLALLICGGANYLLINRTLSGSSEAVARHLEQSASRLQKNLEQVRETIESRKNAPRLTSTPVFIDRVGRLAAENGVPIHAIRPAATNPELFILDIDADYPAFEGFIAELEELDVDVQSFTAKVDEKSGDNPTAAFRIQLLPNNNARELHIPRLTALREQLGQPDRRNPFQRLHAVRSGGEANRIDLTEFLALTGIARIGDRRLATIGGYDYAEGEELAGRVVTSILDDRVLLERSGDNGTERFVVRFATPENSDPPLLPESMGNR